MRKKYFYKLFFKKIFSNYPLQIFSMLSLIVIFCLATLLLSFGFNIITYSKRYIDNNQYLKQLTFTGTSEDIQFVEDNIKTAYLEKRLIYKSNYLVSDVDGVSITDLYIEIGVFEREEFLFDLEEVPKFEYKARVSKNTDDYECVLAFDYAVSLANELNVNVEELLSKKIKINDGFEEKEYYITSIFNKEYTCSIRTYTTKGFFIKDMNIANSKEILSFQFDSLEKMQEVQNQEGFQNILISESISKLKNMQSIMKIIFIVFLFCGMILIISSIGIINSSIKTTFFDDLPFYSMLNLVGFPKKEITYFVTIKTYITVYLSYCLSLPITILMNYIFNKITNLEVLLRIENSKIMSLNIWGVLTALCLITVIVSFLFMFMLRKIKSANISQYYISELNRV